MLVLPTPLSPTKMIFMNTAACRLARRGEAGVQVVAGWPGVRWEHVPRCPYCGWCVRWCRAHFGQGGGKWGSSVQQHARYAKLPTHHRSHQCPSAVPWRPTAKTRCSAVAGWACLPAPLPPRFASQAQALAGYWSQAACLHGHNRLPRWAVCFPATSLQRVPAAGTAGTAGGRWARRVAPACAAVRAGPPAGCAGNACQSLQPAVSGGMPVAGGAYPWGALNDFPSQLAAQRVDHAESWLQPVALGGCASTHWCVGTPPVCAVTGLKCCDDEEIGRCCPSTQPR